MAKRPQGLASSKKNKKAKTAQVAATAVSAGKAPTPVSEKEQSPSEPVAGQEEIHIDMDQEADLENDFTQLQGLWFTYFSSDKENELLLNGIIHECDRLMRLEVASLGKKPVEFYVIYSLALSELAIFQESEEDEERFTKIHDFMETAIDLVESGLKLYPESTLLKLAKSKILFQRIPLEYIAQLAITNAQSNEEEEEEEEESSKNKKNYIIDYKGQEPKDLLEIFEEAKSLYQPTREETTFLQKISKRLALEVLNSVNDLLDMVENFGNEQIYLDEGLDSDDEDEEEELISKAHSFSEDFPLYNLSETVVSDYEWLLENFIELEDYAKNDDDENLFKEVCKNIGELYMKLSYPSSKAYTDAIYNNDNDDEEEEEVIISPTAKEVQSTAIELTTKAKEYLQKAIKEDDPESWIDYCECLIELGNLYEIESGNQVELYKEAENLLKKANKATNGKYQDILDNLLSDK